MTLQSAIDGTGISDIIGSVSDGWGNTTAQPSRVKALKTLSNFSGNGNVVSIPVSRAVKCAAGSRGGETLKCVDIPSVIIANLISDKRILDQLCGGGMNLAHEITNFIETIAGKEHTGKESVFLSPRLSVILLRYIWFNAAVVSLTDSNIKMPSTQCPRALAMTFIGTIWPSEAWLIITTVVSPLFQSRLFPIGTIAVVEILQPVIRM
ncbi:WSSV058 [White spot syndrome virus]|uniref:WSSV058 n=1 Tax=White spot syndrome virus TaxID=342409 RepID=A0A2I6SBJ0_9VIRU|nr:WSSV058 [White spot syndrome virus]